MEIYIPELYEPFTLICKNGSTDAVFCREYDGRISLNIVDIAPIIFEGKVKVLSIDRSFLDKEKGFIKTRYKITLDKDHPYDYIHSILLLLHAVGGTIKQINSKAPDPIQCCRDAQINILLKNINNNMQYLLDNNINDTDVIKLFLSAALKDTSIIKRLMNHE